jgi:glycosyltransferase involved in cell wall biosynthesis
MSNGSAPQITCVIPTFNRAKLLEQAVKSVIEQTFSNWELIIVDNGSSDETAEVVDKYVKNDNRIFYYKFNKKGPAATRNFGVSKAKGKYIVFQDDDDISLPHRFESQLKAMKISGKEFVVSGYEVRTRANNKLIVRRINELKGNGAGFPSRWIITKRLFDKCNGFDEELLTMEDPEFSYRVAQYEVFASHANIVTIIYPSLDSISREGKTLTGRVLMMEKSGNLMHPVEAAWWYYTIALAYYMAGTFKEALKYLEFAVKSDNRSFYKGVYVYLNLLKKASAIVMVRKINFKLFSILGRNVFPNLVEHPVIY